MSEDNNLLIRDEGDGWYSALEIKGMKEAWFWLGFFCGAIASAATLAAFVKLYPV